MNEMSWKRIFWFLVATSVLMHVLWALAPEYEFPADLRRELNFAINGIGSLRTQGIIRLTISFALIGLWAVVGGGLATWRPNARFLYLLLVGVKAFGQGAWALADNLPHASVLYSLTLVVDGLVLLLAYVGPPSRQFERNGRDSESAHVPIQKKLQTSDTAKFACIAAMVLAIYSGNGLLRAYQEYMKEQAEDTVFKTSSEEASEETLEDKVAEKFANLWFAYDHLAMEMSEKGLYRKSLYALHSAIRLVDHEYFRNLDLIEEESRILLIASSLNSLAWIHATAENEDTRDAEKAISFAERAVSIDPDHAYIDTLAAAYANAHQFQKAIELQRKALKGCNETCEDMEAYRARLQSYVDEKPWREYVKKDVFQEEDDYIAERKRGETRQRDNRALSIRASTVR